MKERASSPVMAHVAPSDRERLEREAEREGVTLSTFLRVALRRELNAREQGRNQLAAA